MKKSIIIKTKKFHKSDYFGYLGIRRILTKFKEHDLCIVKFQEKIVDDLDYYSETKIVLKYKWKDRKQFKSKLLDLLLTLSPYITVC